MSEKLSHYDEAGRAHMVDVSAKAETRREAVASAFVELSEAVLAALPQNPKGNPLEVARFAGIQAAKKTADLIPMCHPLALSFVDVQATLAEEIAGKAGLTRVLPARLAYDRVKPSVRVVGWQGSGDLGASARANCYAVLPDGTERFGVGDVITVLLR